MMYPDSHYHLYKLERNHNLRKSAMQQMADELASEEAKPKRPPHFANLMLRIGALLIALGQRLQRRYGRLHPTTTVPAWGYTVE